eukprot:CAMPEP_0194068362 /NCGR_PEP_ID=MMETSP0009_2-20130614/87054_1 /TAXON_ID=210454 /ORGANISM="Grammatophora oceanica, Strain CCMP 410" /LENGTH=209 /DNA_ID=CAMNT_0038721455 /DNA_START=164 /DNA_END=790 /DNA_ORIENTATION=+
MTASPLRLATDGSCFIPNFVKDIRRENTTVSDSCQGQLYTSTPKHNQSFHVVEETKPSLNGYDLALGFATLLVQEPGATVVVACGAVSDSCVSLDAASDQSNDFSDGVVACGAVSDSCVSLDAASDQSNDFNIVPLHTCENLYVEAEHANEREDAIATCEAALLDTIHQATQFHGSIGGIIVDQSAPKAMGQMLLHLMRRAGFRRKMIS